MSEPTTEQMGALYAALAKAQGEMGMAKKTAKNPHLKNKYADLASVRQACCGPLAKNGLAVLQLPQPAEGHACVVTRLGHSGGGFVESVTSVPVSSGNKGVNAAQAMGSAMTYARRYGLSAMVGLAQDDDDGCAAPTPLDLARGRAEAAGLTFAPDSDAARTVFNNCRTIEEYDHFASEARKGRWKPAEAKA